MDECIRLACRNAKELVGDAELLHKAERLESALVFITFAKEEMGKAVMAAEWWFQRTNLTRDQYYETFRSRESHLEKLIAATRIQFTQSMPDILRKRTAEDEIDRRERALYTDYDFDLRRWALPRLEFIAQFDSESAGEADEAFRKFDSLMIQHDIDEIRKDVDSFFSAFEKRKAEHIPGAVIAIPEREPTIRTPSKRYTLEWLQQMEKALLDKRDELRNMVADTKYAKFPSIPSSALIEELRKKLQEEKSDENKRVISKLLVDEFRRNLSVDFNGALYLLEEKREYRKAMEMMNDYVNQFIIPFCKQRRYPVLVKSVMNKANEMKEKRPFDVVQQWRDSYRKCYAIIGADNPSREALREFFELNSTFQIMNGYSEWSLVL